MQEALQQHSCQPRLARALRADGLEAGFLEKPIVKPEPG